MSNYKTKLANIKAFAFDVDGVFTDGSVLCPPSGELIRVYDSKDGMGLRMAYLKGYPIGIITGGDSRSITSRFQDTLATDIYMKSRNKLPDFMDFCNRHNLKPNEVVFVGDDLPDIPVLKVCGLAVCPADAVNEVKEVCDYVSLYKGGKGCVRDLVEQVLKVQGEWVFDPIEYSAKRGIGQ